MVNLTGAAADAVEGLGDTYSGEPGVLAVVYDGSKPILVVEAQTLPTWLAKVAGRGVAVAASCIDPRLLHGIHAVIPSMARDDVIVSAGYDALDDVIVVNGVELEALIAALKQDDPRLEAAARDAVLKGTLSIDARGMAP